MSKRVGKNVKVGTNMDHSHLVPNEATCDNVDFITLILLSPEEVPNNSSPALCQPTLTLESTIASKKRKYKAKKTQNLRNRKTNQDVEQVSSPGYRWRIDRRGGHG